MSVNLEWIPAIEASDRRKAGWIEIELHGGIEAAPGCFLMASPVEENEPAQPKPAAPVQSRGVWRCECCAEIADPLDSSFRWNGEFWQHHHPEGQTHYDCRFFGPHPEPAAPIEEEAAKVECTNCGEMTSEEHYLRGGERHESYYRCEKPAQPEPAAQVCPNCKEPGKPHYFFQSLRESSFASPTFVCEPAATVEMPEVVADALIALRSGAFPNLANDLETFWRSREQQHRFEIKTLEAKYDNERTLRERDARTLPAPGAGTVGMTRELGMVEDAAAARALWHLDNGQRQQFNEITNAISALRAQAAKVQVVPVEATIPVGVWQLEELLKYADLAEVALRTGFHPPEFLFTPADRSLRQCIEAVKEQRDRWLAAEGGR